MISTQVKTLQHFRPPNPQLTMATLQLLYCFSLTDLLLLRHRVLCYQRRVYFVKNPTHWLSSAKVRHQTMLEMCTRGTMGDTCKAGVEKYTFSRNGQYPKIQKKKKRIRKKTQIVYYIKHQRIRNIQMLNSNMQKIMERTILQ